MRTARRLLLCGAAAVLAGPLMWTTAASAADGSGSSGSSGSSGTSGTAGSAGTTGPVTVSGSGPEAGSTPHGTVSCSGNSCTNQKPELTGCDKDAQTIRTGKVVDPATGKAVGIIELRWSAACQTNWARVTSQVGVQPLTATVTRSDAHSVALDFNGTQTWSPMVFVGTTGKAQATGWIGKASGSIADGAPVPGQTFN